MYRQLNQLLVNKGLTNYLHVSPLTYGYLQHVGTLYQHKCSPSQFYNGVDEINM